MTTSVNIACICGNVGRCELRRTQNGTAVLNFSVAVEEYRSNGENYTSWISCSLWGKRADAIDNIMHVGDRVTVSGQLHEQRWETKNGDKRSQIELTVSEINIMSKNSPAEQAQDNAVVDAVDKAFPGAQVTEQQAYANEDLPF